MFAFFKMQTKKGEFEPPTKLAAPMLHCFFRRNGMLDLWEIMILINIFKKIPYSR